jgi:hypothetical protein
MASPPQHPPWLWSYPAPDSGFCCAFNLDDARKLAKICGPLYSAKARGLLRLLCDRDDAIKVTRWIFDILPPRATQRKDRHARQQKVASLKHQFQSADWQARVDTARYLAERSRLEITPDNLDRILAEIHCAFARATKEFPAHGPIYLASLRLCCAVLADVYEQFTGRPFTYDGRSDRGNEFLTKGACFVAQAARHYFPAPEPTDANLVTAMRWVVKARRTRKIQ